MQTMKNFTKKQHPLGFWQAHPMPTCEELEKYYADVYYQQCVPDTYAHEYTEEEMKHNRNRIAVIDEVLSRLKFEDDREEAKKHEGSRKRSVIDIGCGEGFLMDYFFRQGWEVLGIDFSSCALERWHPHLLPYSIKGELCEGIGQLIQQEKVFDLVSTLRVMQTVLDPDLMLEQIKGIMSKKSLLVISVSNNFSPLQRAMLERGLIEEEYWFVPPDHLQYFDLNSLSALLKSHGFRVVFRLAEFPIEFYLVNEHSRYYPDRSKGKAAHNSRLFIDNFLMSQDLKKYVDYASAMADVGLGRDIMVFAELDV